MIIIRKYNDEKDWEIVSVDETIEKTEGRGYYSPGTAREILQNGGELRMPWAVYKLSPAHVYYYTFGSDPAFPYCGGWVEVYANSWEESHEKFRTKYPDRPGREGVINCAFFYDQEMWGQSGMANGNLGGFCHEVII